MVIKQLNKENCTEILELTHHLNTETTLEVLKERQMEMFEFGNYICFGGYQENTLVAISSGWLTVRLYSGRQLEVDNVIISPNCQSQGVGTEFLQVLEEWAKTNKCKTVELNTYVQNGRSHKFYFNQGYEILGFHFQKNIS